MKTRQSYFQDSFRAFNEINDAQPFSHYVIIGLDGPGISPNLVSLASESGLAPHELIQLAQKALTDADEANK